MVDLVCSNDPQSNTVWSLELLVGLPMMVRLEGRNQMKGNPPSPQELVYSDDPESNAVWSLELVYIGSPIAVRSEGRKQMKRNQQWIRQIGFTQY